MELFNREAAKKRAVEIADRDVMFESQRGVLDMIVDAIAAELQQTVHNAARVWARRLDSGSTDNIAIYASTPTGGTLQLLWMTSTYSTGVFAIVNIYDSDDPRDPSARISHLVTPDISTETIMGFVRQAMDNGVVHDWLAKHIQVDISFAASR